MLWLRLHKHIGGVLGLAALGLQLILSFGHIHAEDFKPAAGDLVLAGAASLAVDGSTTPDQPPLEPDHDDYCPVCATMHLAGTLMLPEPPLLPIPSAWTHRVLRPAIVNTLQVSRYSLFQTRAPPVL